MSAQYWLLKTEPETYSFETLAKEKRTAWNGVRNFQARNFLKEMKVGDLALIYHSGKDKAVVGVAKICKGGYPEIDKSDPKNEWVQVDIQFEKPLKESIPLKTIKEHPTLKSMMLVKQSRLSVMPVDPKQFDAIIKLGGAK